MPDSLRRPSPKELFYGSVTIGERGQIVIPAEARKNHALAPGDKLLVFRHPHLHGVVLARLDDVETLLGEMRQWMDLVERVRAEEADVTAGKRRPKKGERQA